MDWKRIIDEIEENTGKSVYKEIGCRSQFISDLRSGKSKNPGADFVFKLVKNFDLNIDYLITGEGEMFVKDEKKDLQEKTVRVPLLRQSVSCGPGQDWAHNDNIEDFIELGQIFPVPIKNVYAFRAAGESMIGAGIRHGDILFFDGSKNQELGAGGIFVFGWNGDAYCKLLQFERLSNTIRVYSYEKSSVQQAEFIRAIKGDDDSLVIFGRVLGWMHENTIMPLYNNVGKLLQ